MEVDWGRQRCSTNCRSTSVPSAPPGLALAPSRPNSEPKLPREGGTGVDVIVVAIIRTNPLTGALPPSEKRSTSTLSLPRTLLMQPTSPETETVR